MTAAFVTVSDACDESWRTHDIVRLVWTADLEAELLRICTTHDGSSYGSDTWTIMLDPVVDSEFLRRVAERLTALTDAVVFDVEYPGWISGTCDGGAHWAIGDANGDLSADYYTTDDQSDGPSFSLSAPLSPDPVASAEALYDVMANYDDAACSECARSFGPHYSGPCDH